MVQNSRDKRIIAKFYRTDKGTEPVRDWLRSLATEDCRIVGRDIAKVEMGWPIGMPTCRKVTSDLYEVRSTIQSGKVEARTYFHINGNMMLLLHGAEGKDGQHDDILVATDRLKRHRRQP